MLEALRQLDSTMGYVRALMGIYRALRSSATGILDLTDILRAELVLALSAFDYFIHELVRIGMLEVAAGQRPTNSTFLHFDVGISNALRASRDPMDQSWLDEEIRARHGWLSFQNPDRVADALRLIIDRPLWPAVASMLPSGMSAEEARAKLKALVDRRNRIAHEADMDPENPGRRTPITDAFVDDAEEFLAAVARAIYDTVR